MRLIKELWNEKACNYLRCHRWDVYCANGYRLGSDILCYSCVRRTLRRVRLVANRISKLVAAPFFLCSTCDRVHWITSLVNAKVLEPLKEAPTCRGFFICVFVNSQRLMVTGQRSRTTSLLRALLLLLR